MATIAGTGEVGNRGDFKAVWNNLANGDDGSAQFLGAYPDKSVQVEGTFGTGGTLIIEASNDGSLWRQVKDPQGTPISLGAAGLEQILETAQYFRPRVTGGDGTTNLNVFLSAKARGR